MLIFSSPKAFMAPFDVVQRNAIGSWRALGERCQIMLFGQDKGTAEAASEFGAVHVPEIGCSVTGAPLVSAMFREAHARSEARLLCFINADIMLTPAFLRAVQRIPFRRFLMVGGRWTVLLGEPWDFNVPDWAPRLETYTEQQGRLDNDPPATDYFVFTRGVFDDIPPFVLGRAGYDNWLVYEARRRGIPVIDASPVVKVAHHAHQYSHLSGGEDEMRRGEEAKRNLSLAPPASRTFTFGDATWFLTPKGLRPALSWQRLRRHWVVLQLLHPGAGRLVQICKGLTRRARRLLRLGSP